MAAPYNPPVRGEDFQTDIQLEDWQQPGRFAVDPTLAAGDVKVSKDGGALANITTLPSASPAGSVNVAVALSATEMTADKVTVIFRDQTSPPAWADYVLTIITSQ